MRAEIVKINSESPESSLVKYAADQIRAGEVLGHADGYVLRAGGRSI